jgi:hypothetical protein
MARKRIVRGPSSLLASAVLFEAERVYDTTLQRERMGDGVTPGGLLQLAADDLDAIGIVNVNDQVTINGGTTIANVFPAAYVITDSGTPANFNIVFPSGAAVGSVVYFRVRVTATKLFSLYDGGTDMEGDDRIVLQAGESILLFKESTGWKRLGGVRVPIQGVLKRSADQTGITSATWTPVVYQSCVSNARGLSHGFDTINSQFKAPRKGVYRFAASLTMNGVTNDTAAEAAFTSALNTSPSISPQSFAAVYGIGARRTLHPATTLALGRDGNVGVTVRGSGTPTIEHVTNVIECILSFEELLT